MLTTLSAHTGQSRPVCWAPNVSCATDLGTWPRKTSTRSPRRTTCPQECFEPYGFTPCTSSRRSAPWSDQRQPLPGTAPHCAGVTSVRTVRRGDNTTHTALLSKPQDMQRRAQIHQEHAASPHIQLPIRRACSRPSNTALSPEPIQQHSVLPVGGRATLGLSDENLLGGEARVGGTASTSGIPGAAQVPGMPPGRRRPHHGQLPLLAQVKEYGGGTSTHKISGAPNSAPILHLSETPS